MEYKLVKGKAIMTYMSSYTLNNTKYVFEVKFPKPIPSRTLQAHIYKTQTTEGQWWQLVKIL
jgi:hypothetical protein